MAEDPEPIHELLQLTSPRHLIRIDVGLEGNWSGSPHTIWTKEGGFLGFEGTIDRHPHHRPALEFLFPDGWIGIRCYRRQGGLNVLDLERAKILVDEMIRNPGEARP